MVSYTTCAIFWRERRRQQGVPPKADMPTALPERVYKQGRELNAMYMLPALDWPKDLFSAARADSALAGQKPTDAHLCACGCKQRHNLAVSGLEGESGYRRINWYRTIACKNKHLGIGR